ncbi:MAG: ligand-binding sensor domain-containing protein, partial [Chitinophagaceae bacterium]
MRKSFADTKLTGFMRALLYLLLLFCLPALLWAQNARQYSFKHFSTLNGLVSNSVNSVAQDADGYMWMATSNGLQRYDGNSFLTFKASEGKKGAIPSTNIIALYTDKAKNLWLLGDNQRLGYFDTRKFEFTPVHLPDGVVLNSHQRFVEFPQGELMVLDNKGNLYQYRAGRKAFEPAPHLAQKPQDITINHMVWDERQKKFWISANEGLLLFDPASRRFYHRGYNPINDPAIRAFENIK